MPILERDGGYETELFGVKRTARGDEELAQLERDIADVGYYSFVTTADEAERLSGDEVGRDALLHRLMNERVAAWLELATERLADSEVPLYLMPGNDDDFGIDPVLDGDGYATVNADGKVLDIPGGLQLLASGWSNITPWKTPREETEDELYDRLDGARQPGARPAPRRLHDPRAAARLRSRHGADPRREPPPDHLGRRRPAWSGRLARRCGR